MRRVTFQQGQVDFWVRILIIGKVFLPIVILSLKIFAKAALIEATRHAGFLVLCFMGKSLCHYCDVTAFLFMSVS